MEERTIVWSTVVVTSHPRGFELAVDLEGDQSADWDKYFSDVSSQDALRMQQRRWGLVRLSDTGIVMEGLDAGAREEARAYLEALVRKTNDLVWAKLEALEQERLEREAQEIELNRTAEELTDWFRATKQTTPRGSSAASRKGEETEVAEEPPEPARPLELPDLASRFANPAKADQPSA